MRNIDIEKNARYLTDKERALLLIRHAFEKVQNKNKGLLSAAEIVAIAGENSAVLEQECEKYMDLCRRATIVAGKARSSYQLFQYYYEMLKRIHLLMYMSPGIEVAVNVIKNGVLHRIKTKAEYELMGNDVDGKEQLRDDYNLVIMGGEDDLTMKTANGELSIRTALTAVLSYLRSLQVIDEKTVDYGTGKIASFKDSISNMKELVSELHKEANIFLTLVHVLKKIDETLGFKAFVEEHSISEPIYMASIASSIKEHNEIILRCSRDEPQEFMLQKLGVECDKHDKHIVDIEKYLIQEPAIDKKMYEDWEMWLEL